ncbi:MAG: purine-nucleoside phosphorylase [Paracoccaceae bacterium]
MDTPWKEAAAVITDRAGIVAPVAGIVLGSGLGTLTQDTEEAITIPFSDLPGFPVSMVSGHAGSIMIGHLRGKRVALLSGRSHYYERGDAAAMAVPVRTMAELGIGVLALSNAAGSTQRHMGPGSLMALNDHINFSGRDPLIGYPDDSRFTDMSNVYDPELRAILHKVAGAQGTKLNEGVYAWFSGPSFETPAEIRAITMLGASAVGMSTVPETILARHAGMRVAAVSVITNLAAGMQAEALSHDQTKRESAKAADSFKNLFAGFVEALD